MDAVTRQQGMGLSHELEAYDGSDSLLMTVEELEDIAHAQQGMAADLDDLEASLGIQAQQQSSRVSISAPSHAASRDYSQSPGSLRKADSHPLPGLEHDLDEDDDENEADSADLRGRGSSRAHVVFAQPSLRGSVHSGGSLQAEVSLSPVGAAGQHAGVARRDTKGSLGLHSPPESPPRWGHASYRTTELDVQGIPARSQVQGEATPTSSGMGIGRNRTPSPAQAGSAVRRSGPDSARSPWREPSRASSKSGGDRPRSSPKRGMHDPLTPAEEAVNTMYYRELRAQQRLQERQAAVRNLMANEELVECSFRPNVSPGSQRIVSLRRSLSPPCSAPCSLALSAANVSAANLSDTRSSPAYPESDGRALSSPRSRPLLPSKSQVTPLSADPSTAILFSNKTVHDRLFQHADLVHQKKEMVRQAEAESEEQARKAFRARSPGGRGPQALSRYRDLPPPKTLQQAHSQAKGLYIGTFQTGSSKPLQPLHSQPLPLQPSPSLASQKTAATYQPPWANPFNRFQDSSGDDWRAFDAQPTLVSTMSHKLPLKSPAKSTPAPLLGMTRSAAVSPSRIQRMATVHPGVLSAAVAQRNESFAISHPSSAKVGLSTKSVAGSHASRIAGLQSFPIAVVPASGQPAVAATSPAAGRQSPGCHTIHESEQLGTELSAAFLERQQMMLTKQQLRQEQAWADIAAIQSTRNLSPGTQRILGKKLQEGEVYVPPHQRPLSPGTQPSLTATNYLRGSSPLRMTSRSPRNGRAGSRALSPAYSTSSRPSSEGPRAHRLFNVDLILRSRSNSGCGTGPTFTFKPQITPMAAAMPSPSVEQLMDGGRAARDAWLDALRAEKEMVEAQQHWGELAYVARPSPTALGKPYLSLRRPSEYLAVMSARKAAAEAQAQRAREDREAREMAECSFKPKTTPLPMYLARQHGLSVPSTLRRSRQATKSVGGEASYMSCSPSARGSYSAMQHVRHKPTNSLQASYSAGGFVSSEGSAMFLASLVAEGESEAQLFPESSRGASPARSNSTPAIAAYNPTATPSPHTVTPAQAYRAPTSPADQSQAKVSQRQAQPIAAVGSLQQLAQELAQEQSSASSVQSSRLAAASGQGSPSARAVLAQRSQQLPLTVTASRAQPEPVKNVAAGPQQSESSPGEGYIPAAWWQPAAHAVQEAQEAERIALTEVFGPDGYTAPTGPGSKADSVSGSLEWPKPSPGSRSGTAGGASAAPTSKIPPPPVNTPGAYVSPTQDLSGYRVYLNQLRNNL